MKHIVSVSLDESTVKKIMALRRNKRFRNKSHVVEEAIIQLWGDGE